ncbi:MAG TPA: SDR family oxidoreductase [Bryobacteraceae bacterium]|jgi:NAD(P)-dependent dehydrogenase (short-subunit alcohol dehydrogenase family)
MPALESQIALVTGAARGVGAAIALRLSSLGAHVLLVARDTQRLNQVAGQIHSNQGQATVLPCDLTDAAAIVRLGEQVARDYKRCDILVNNAAIGGTGQPLHEVRVDDWDQLMDTNLRAPYLLIRHLAPLMIAARSGHIINISSLAGHNPLPRNAPYAASKWGLNGLTYSVAEELRPHHIRVSVIAPGSINTHFEGGDTGKDPNKMLQPDDIAAVVASIVTQAPQSFISEVLIRPTQKP